MKETSVVIIGEGPVALAAAIFAARNNYKVIVLCNEGDEEAQVCLGNLLGERGLKVLDKIGLENISEDFKFQGTVNVSQTSVQIEDHDGQEYLMEKNKLSSILRDYINKHYLSQIQIRYEKLLSIDFDKKIAKCLYNDTTTEYGYKFLIGADGQNSKVRSLLQESKIISTQVKYVSQEINSIFGPFSLSDFQTPHLQNHFQGQGRALLYAKPNSATDDKKVHSIIIFNQNEQFFVQITYPQSLQTQFQEGDFNSNFRNYLSEKYGDLIPGEWINKIEKENQQNAGVINSLISCRYDENKLGKNVVLLGDAAHTVPGIFNQDLNFGLQDCEVLNQIFEQASEKSLNIDQCVQNFVQKRQPDIDAFETIELCGLILTTTINEISQSQKYWLFALILPNVIFLQFLNIFLPSFSRYTFMLRIKDQSVNFQKLLQEMWIVAIFGWIFIIVFMFLFAYLGIQFMLVYFIRVGAMERFESMLRLVNEAFHFV